MLKTIKNKLIVSCQALSDEPLYSSFIMGRMSRAATEGGASAIRANSKEDIVEIKKQTDLPIIGLVKRHYQGVNVYITATIKEVDELIDAGCDMIALDATKQERPDGETLEEFVKAIRKKYDDVLLMADTSTVLEGVEAERLGFDVVSTTLVGYTSYTEDQSLFEDDYAMLKEYVEKISIPVIAEGNVKTPKRAKAVLDHGAYAVVVGSAITRPQVITQRFIKEIES
ncbi:N-acetylmannosamine-6-phosphate 2-epimerase [Alkalibacterium kapii]|uniref:Putative N-acetylmannosamine-6-phosphate 2-epimerase n=1 Tax=Alkalibacterium kapii TaxID=426704 RepID=A0A511AQT9_9LACT|nr:N-acetylmannosamine-6-phosphate 2-epimerase [Alkalibacterium kapii]GEK90570.1 putative N-acetylmannosamine-6-phosphate 2-epimerase [Alkalibacterium kapii]